MYDSSWYVVVKFENWHYRKLVFWSWYFRGYMYHIQCVNISLMCGLSLQLKLWTGHRGIYPQGTKNQNWAGVCREGWWKPSHSQGRSSQLPLHAWWSRLPPLSTWSSRSQLCVWSAVSDFRPTTLSCSQPQRFLCCVLCFIEGGSHNDPSKNLLSINMDSGVLWLPHVSLRTIMSKTPCTSVLTRTQTLYQEVLPIPMVPCSTMLRQAAVEWLVYLMTHSKNSPVQFVPNKE